MARFIGRARGARGEASRLGTPSSGVRVEANGWDVGVRVEGFVDDDGRDAFRIYVSGGSNRRAMGYRQIATVRGGVVNLKNGEQAHRIDGGSHMVAGRPLAQDGRWEDGG